MCNVIPGATTEFRAALGAVNRPFASPGDFVRLHLRVQPSDCDAESTGFCGPGSTGFCDLEGGTQRSDDYVVALLFTPPQPTPPEPGAPRNAVVLAEDCAALATELAACDLALTGDASCVDVDGGPGASGLVIPDDENLFFRFPDTDAALAPDGDDRTFTGPVRIVVDPCARQAYATGRGPSPPMQPRGDPLRRRLGRGGVRRRTNLSGTSSTFTRVYLHHPTLATPLRVDQGTGISGSSSNGAVSADGARVAFERSFQVFVRDRDTDGDGVFDEPGAVSTTPVGGRAPSISPDGRYVSFRSASSSIVPGDTNDDDDIFVHDLKTGLTERVNVSSEGLQAEGGFIGAFFKHSLSREGRFVVFESDDSNLVARDTGGSADVFVHDRLTGITQRVSVRSDGSHPDRASADTSGGSLSADGQTAFLDSNTDLDPLRPGDGAFVRGPDLSDLDDDLTGDGDLGDVVLRVLDTRSDSPQAVELGPAGTVSVAGGAAAFLLPESASGLDRNADGDLEDAFVHLSVGGAARQDLAREAVAIALSPRQTPSWPRWVRGSARTAKERARPQPSATAERRASSRRRVNASQTCARAGDAKIPPPTDAAFAPAVRDVWGATRPRTSSACKRTPPATAPATSTRVTATVTRSVRARRSARTSGRTATVSSARPARARAASRSS
jgi:Tol biopolymer transport system component